MKAPDVVLRNALLADATFAGLAGTRLHPLQVPRDTALPFVTYRRSALRRTQTLAGPMGVPTASIEYTVVGTTYASARTVADAIRAVLDGYNGTSENTTVRQTSLEDEADELAQLQGAELSDVFTIRQTYDVMYQET